MPGVRRRRTDYGDVQRGDYTDCLAAALKCALDDTLHAAVDAVVDAAGIAATRRLEESFNEVTTLALPAGGIDSACDLVFEDLDGKLHTAFDIADSVLDSTERVIASARRLQYDGSNEERDTACDRLQAALGAALHMLHSLVETAKGLRAECDDDQPDALSDVTGSALDTALRKLSELLDSFKRLCGEGGSARQDRTHGRTHDEPRGTRDERNAMFHVLSCNGGYAFGGPQRPGYVLVGDVVVRNESHRLRAECPYPNPFSA